MLAVAIGVDIPYHDIYKEMTNLFVEWRRCQAAPCVTTAEPSPEKPGFARGLDACLIRASQRLSLLRILEYR